MWDGRYSPSSYTWNGGFHENHRWTLPHRPDAGFPTDAEILFELFLSKESVSPLDVEHPYVVTLQDGSRTLEDHLRRRGNTPGGGAFLKQSERGLHLSVIAPHGCPNVSLPVWQVPPGQGNLPAAIALFVYYMTYVDDQLGDRGMWLPNADQPRFAVSGPGGSSGSGATAAISAASSDAEQGMCYLLAVEAAGAGTWGLLRREIFNGSMLNSGPRDPRVDGMAAPLGDAELQQRLAAREAARHAGDFEQAAQLLDQLRVRGVWLDDAARRWTTSDGRAGLYPASSAAGLSCVP